MNQYDQLLDWASELGNGRWSDWRSACAYLKLEATEAARALSDLGHVEVDWGRDLFAAAPPAAVLLPRSSGSVVITGARPRGLLGRIQTLACDGDFDVYCCDPSEQVAGPETWLCEGNLDDFPGFCAEVGLAFQIQSGRALAEALPRATLDTVGVRERPSDRLPREWFDPNSLRWRLTDPTTQGCWWVQQFRRKVAYVLRDTEWTYIPVREYGLYVAYRDSPFIRYSAKGMTLEVSRVAPLPPLLARAATLQTGRLPSTRGALTYANVDAELASLIADRLGIRMTLYEVIL